MTGLLHCAQGALVGGGMPCASLPGICVCAGAILGSLEVGPGNRGGGKSAFVANADLFAQGAAVSTPAAGVDVALLAQGAAVPTPEPGIEVALLAHGAFVPSCGGVGRAEAFSNDKPGPSLTGWLEA